VSGAIKQRIQTTPAKSTAQQALPQERFLTSASDRRFFTSAVEERCLKERFVPAVFERAG
jgi:hypothetical protein